MRTRVICLGNAMMSDDGVAIHVARALRKRGEAESLPFDLVESAVAGYDLLELMEGWDQVIFVEAVKLSERQPGELVRLEAMSTDLQLRACSAREASVAEIMAVGAKLGRSMPSDVRLLGVQGDDLCTFGETLSPAVAEAVPRIADAVLAEAVPGD